jgi:hypothetical protein
MSIPDQLLKLDSYYFLLFVIPGFITVWTYRTIFKVQKKGDFEYLGLSVFWGLVIFLFSIFATKNGAMFSYIFGELFPFSLVPASVILSAAGFLLVVGFSSGMKLPDLILGNKNKTITTIQKENIKIKIQNIMFLKDKIWWAWLISSAIIGVLVRLLTKDWNVTALMFTAIILLWYSTETRKLRITSLDSYRLSRSPFLTLRYRKTDLGWDLILTNQGKFVALNPEINIINKEKHPSLKFKLYGVNAINSGDWVPIGWEVNGEINKPNYFNDLDENPLKVEIISYSILGELCPSEAEIKKPYESKILKTPWN